MSKKISVVMPTYNGEKYIEEQLMSILNQTVKPNEIIVSDDGSKDNTLTIVERFKQIAQENGIDVRILTDNLEHGWIKNYEWASRHATGDYIFNCDQDDVWMDNKVEEVIKVFEEHPDALYVAHSLSLINKLGENIGEVDLLAYSGEENEKHSDSAVKLDSQKYLSKSVSYPLMQCMATCVTKDLLSMAIPFPNNCSVDQWEPFCALCVGKAYYIKNNLAKYRLHENNTTGSDPNMGIINKLKRVYNHFQKAKFNIAPYYGGKAMIEMLEKCNLKETSAYQEAIQVAEMGEQKKEIAERGRIVGAIKLIILFMTSLRFRKSDPKEFPYQLWAILKGKVDI